MRPSLGPSQRWDSSLPESGGHPCVHILRAQRRYCVHMRATWQKHKHRWGWGGRIYIGSYFIDVALFRHGKVF